MNLVFAITEGPKTGVSGITFIGNQAFGDARLQKRHRHAAERHPELHPRRRQLRSRPALLRRGEAAPLLPRPRLCRLPGRLLGRRPRPRAQHLLHHLHDERGAALPVRRRSTSIRRIPGVDPASCRARRSSPTRATSSPAPRSTSRSRRSRFISRRNGYPFAQARPRLDRDPETLTIGVTYVVDEGARVYIERIDIRGNTRTRDYVIRREFDIAEGDAFNRVLIDRAERRLRGLGYFTNVHITTEPGSSDDRVIVVVNVVEQPTGEFSFGVGYSTSDGAVGDISLTETQLPRPRLQSARLGRRRHQHAELRGRLHRSLFPRPAHFGRRQRLPPHLRREQLPLLRLRDDRRRPHLRLPDHRGFHGPDGLQDRAAGDQRRRLRKCDGRLARRQRLARHLPGAGRHAGLLGLLFADLRLARQPHGPA